MQPYNQVTVKHESIVYEVRIEEWPDENGDLMSFRVLSVDLADGVCDYEDLLKIDELYEEVLDELERKGKD